MTERPIPSLENAMPDLLRKFNYLNPRDCELSTFLFHQPTQTGALRTFHITRISTKSKSPNEAGYFDFSFDFIRPKTQVDYFEPPLEKEDHPIPSYPSYRFSVSRLNDINNTTECFVDETFEPSAATIHRRLMKEIAELKKAKGKEAYDAISKVLQQISEFN